MISVLAACILGNTAILSDVTLSHEHVPAAVVADTTPQGPRTINRKGPGAAPFAPPSGGTPEPASMLLLAGGALTYGGMRLRNRRKQLGA